MEAYSNLEDLLDVAWEEEDLAPPTKVGAIVAKCNGVLSKPEPTPFLNCLQPLVQLV